MARLTAQDCQGMQPMGFSSVHFFFSKENICSNTGNVQK